MRSKKVTLSIPHRLWDALERHAKEVGYTSARELLTWSPLYSLLIQRPHSITAPIAGAPPDLQDELVEQIVSAYERGDIKKHSYFEQILADIAQRLAITTPPDIVHAVVADTVRSRAKKV